MALFLDFSPKLRVIVEVSARLHPEYPGRFRVSVAKLFLHLLKELMSSGEVHVHDVCCLAIQCVEPGRHRHQLNRRSDAARAQYCHFLACHLDLNPPLAFTGRLASVSGLTWSVWLLLSFSSCGQCGNTTSRMSNPVYFRIRRCECLPGSRPGPFLQV